MHFSTQRNECRPCAIDYDYIIKLESIHEDIQYIMVRYLIVTANIREIYLFLVEKSIRGERFSTISISDGQG